MKIKIDHKIDRNLSEAHCWLQSAALMPCLSVRPQFPAEVAAELKGSEIRRQLVF
jgi:hypothetical protein